MDRPTPHTVGTRYNPKIKLLFYYYRYDARGERNEIARNIQTGPIIVDAWKTAKSPVDFFVYFTGLGAMFLIIFAGFFFAQNNVNIKHRNTHCMIIRHTTSLK